MACPVDCKKPKCLSMKKGLVDFSKQPIVWVLGGPGSGKGTQCDKIVAKYGFTHLSSGDLLRAEIKTGSERANNLNSVMQGGGLVPNEVVLDLLKEAIDNEAGKSNGFLIDGYPREENQGRAFEECIGPVTTLIYFEVSAETMTQRLLSRAVNSGRVDDNEDTIKLRLRTFFENNDKVLASYSSKLNRINGERPADEIFRDVEAILDPIVAIHS
ncbi:adenylate kinase isoenzyme 1-like [Pectinophora gossypiella]|uniref:adenylate kinase isoenzyme 1-like n=1 Tax=Pectinophora gossypiella TaxID=13191 RepID=UPI00214E52DD|nr:adenylate kinase isoenzyme 1-like [Pectinophora gossypiella]